MTRLQRGIGPVLKFFCWIFLFIYQFAQAGFVADQKSDILAYWSDSQHLKVQVPGHLLPRTGLRFFLRDQTPQNLNLELPVLSSTHDAVLLNTAAIPQSQLRELINKNLVLDVLSGSFLMFRTGIILSGLLDDLFYTEAPLGQTWSPHDVVVSVWSPTAQEMKLQLFESAEAPLPVEILPMQVNLGVWSVRIPRNFEGFYYRLQVQGFYPDLQRVVNTITTDPYSPGLSANGEKTLLVDLDSSSTKPELWDNYPLPAATKTTDSVIYESHIRDLTAHDRSVPSRLRGKYLALTIPGSTAYAHLADLQKAGITHLHLLPFNDFASVPELEKDQDVLPEHNWLAPDEAPTALARIRARDNYNWGYDPVHYLSPEGSYATDPNGVSRIKEIRKMIQTIHTLGLRLTQDVVFNHTFAADFTEFSVLHKIVPFYYHRLESKGFIANSSCCADTASENRMMERLMRDALIHWIRNFHMTSFRFDLMSFHSRETMVRLRDVIRHELKNKFGISNDAVLIYGEAWPFGSLHSRSPESAMTQLNSFGAGIGVFNDRFRDAIRGGTTNLSEPSDQGFATGLLDNFNFSPRNRNTPLNESERAQKYLHLKDVVKIGLAGNLRDFRFTEHRGTEQAAGNIHYRGSAVAYSQTPQETINYVSAHDGTTLWDAIQAKLAYRAELANPDTTEMWERVRRSQLALSFVLFGQGIPFIEAGSEILRSKNGDVDSYDSGDFYNAMELNKTTNHWNRALPPEWKNGSEWGFWHARITDSGLSPSASDLSETYELFKAMLKLRKRHPEFRMEDLSQIQQRLAFLDVSYTDAAILPLSLKNKTGKELLVVWNVARTPKQWQDRILYAKIWQVSPELTKQNTPWLQDISLTSSTLSLPPLSFVVLEQQSDYR